MAFIIRREGEAYRPAANFGFPPDYAALLKDPTVPPRRRTATRRAVVERRAVQIADVMADPEYALDETYQLGKARTMLAVPLRHENEPIGTINLARRYFHVRSDGGVHCGPNFGTGSHGRLCANDCLGYDWCRRRFTFFDRRW